LKFSVLISGVLGLGLGILLGFVRMSVNNADMEERKKLRHIKNFLKKKGRGLFRDRRIFGIVSLLLLIGLPFYLGHQSQSPIFFGIYSAKAMLINTVYVLALLFSMSFYIYLMRNKS
jgi:hypothetical protein